MWDAANTVGTSRRDGLIRQARGNVTGAQQGAPASDEVIFGIVDYELGIGHAQSYAAGAGSLTARGANGGPENAIAQPLVNARFDLFDAWKDSSNVAPEATPTRPTSCSIGPCTVTARTSDAVR